MTQQASLRLDVTAVEAQIGRLEGASNMWELFNDHGQSRVTQLPQVLTLVPHDHGKEGRACGTSQPVQTLA